MRKPRSPTDPIITARNAARMGRPIRKVQKGEFGLPKDEVKWADPEFVRRATIDGHYVTDGCSPSHWREKEYRHAYSRANTWWFYRINCMRCGKDVRINHLYVQRDKTQVYCMECLAITRGERKDAKLNGIQAERERRMNITRDTLSEIAMGKFEAILLFRAMGMSYEEIGLRFDISRERIRQLLRRMTGESPTPAVAIAYLVTHYKLVPVDDTLMPETGVGERGTLPPLQGTVRAV